MMSNLDMRIYAYSFVIRVYFALLLFIARTEMISL